MQIKRLQKSVFRKALLALLLVSLAACGFHLRGSGGGAGLAGKQIAIESLSSNKTMPELVRLLKRQLVSYGATVLESGFTEPGVIDSGADVSASDTAELQLQLIELTTSSRGVSRDATGRANQHEITAQLSYLLQDEKREQTELKSLGVSDSYYQDYRNPTAASQQRRRSEKQLLESLASKLLRRLEFEVKNP